MSLDNDSLETDDDSFNDAELTHLALEIMNDLSTKPQFDPEDSYIDQLAHDLCDDDIPMHQEISSKTPPSLSSLSAASSTADDRLTFIAHSTSSIHSGCNTFNESICSSKKKDYHYADETASSSLCPRRLSNILSISRHNLNKKHSVSLVPDFSSTPSNPSSRRKKRVRNRKSVPPKNSKQRRKLDAYLYRRDKLQIRLDIDHDKDNYTERRRPRARRATADCTFFKSNHNKTQIKSRARNQSVENCKTFDEYAVATKNKFVFMNRNTHY